MPNVAEKESIRENIKMKQYQVLLYIEKTGNLSKKVLRQV